MSSVPPQSLNDNNVFARPAVPSRELSAILEHPDTEVLLESQQELSELAEPVHEVIMALYSANKSSLGCAYFSTRDSTLYLSEDIPMAGLDIAEQLINHAEPTTLLVSARTPKFLLDFLESKAVSGTNEQSTNFTLHALGSQDFTLMSARERLARLEFDELEPLGAIMSMANDLISIDAPGGQAKAYGPLSVRILRCGSYIDLESHASISCAGAILGDLHRRRSVGFLPDGQSAEVVFHVTSLQMFSISDYMFISSETMQALQIVQAELHPNSQTWGVDQNSTSSRESLSIYGLFHNIACTPQGRSFLRQIFLRPTLNLSTIAERQRSISILLRPDNTELVKQAGVVLRKLKNVKLALEQLRKGVNSPTSSTSFDRGIWATIRGFAARVLRLRELIGGFSDASNIRTLTVLLDTIQPVALMTIGDAVNRTVDFEQSKLRNRLSIKPGADKCLDKLMQKYAGVRIQTDRAALASGGHLSREARNRIKSCTFFPQLGFLVVVEPDPFTGTAMFEIEDGNGKRWERVFTADASVCYKNDLLRELDELYGNAYREIGDQEVELVHRLAGDILKHEKLLLNTSEACGHFDAILALAVGAERYSWVAPQMTEANILDIKNGRHPLQELLVPSFVPNDCHISTGHVGPMGKEESDHAPQTLLLTGPNHSGKSIYLKQTAIIVYLAHIGSYVPADKALIGLTDKILTRMSTRESVSRNESAFAIDLRQVAQAIRCSTPRSLLVVDEFGKGTNNDDGAGLLAAMLNHFLSLGKKGPRLLIATHFHEVFEGGYIDDPSGLRLAHMDVKAAPAAGQSQKRFAYLYKFASGHSSSSFGTQCAELNGVPAEIVTRAESLTQLLCQNEDIRTACGELSVEETNRLQQAEEVARRFLNKTFSDKDTNIKETLEVILHLK